MQKVLSWVGFTLFCVFSGTSLQAQQRHALIFAIGNYPASGGWTPISSQRDLYYLQQSLTRQGFAASQITVVKDSMATKAGIISAFEALLKRVKPNDIVYVHFSSHGQQIEDDNKDEADGLDESIVSYNAVLSTDPAQYSLHQQNYFRDDQLGSYVLRLRRILGADGDLAVFINACHSGTGIRGSNKVRGGKAPMVSAAFKPEGNGIREEKSLMQEEGEEAGPLSPYVIISAARANELDFEVKDEQALGVGSLTYSTCRALEQLGHQTTYRNLFVQIQLIMLEKSLRQHPVLEGNGADRLLFGGQFREQQAYAEIQKRVNTREYWLDKGRLAGLDAGAKVAVYAAGTAQTDGQKALATGIVTEATLYTAKIKLTSDPRLSSIAAGWVFVTEPVFNITPVSIRVEKQGSKAVPNGFTAIEADAWQKRIQQLNMAVLSPEPDLVLVKGRTMDTLKVAGSGLAFSQLPRKEENKDDWLQHALQDYRCYKFIRDLEISDPGTSAEVRLLPFVKGEVDTVNTRSWMKNGIYEFYEGDTVVLQVVNKSRQAIYLNLMDLQPNGLINVLLPNKAGNVFPEDLKIKAGESRLFDQYTIALHPPYGNELFKIFLSRTELDLEDLVAARGSGAERGSFSYMEKLLRKTYGMQGRGGVVTAGAKAEGMATGLVFIIKPGSRTR